jgi:hypothetical protein
MTTARELLATYDDGWNEATSDGPLDPPYLDGAAAVIQKWHDAEVAKVHGERDRARDLAAALEAEGARTLALHMAKAEEEIDRLREEIGIAVAQREAATDVETIRSAIRDEWHRRIDEQMAGSPDDHIDALTTAIVTALRGGDGTYILTPEAVGDPNQTPIVHCGPDLVALLKPCACGGVNGFHRETCSNAAAMDGGEPS